MPEIGDPAPDFTGNDFINSVPFTLSDYAGEVIVLTFVWFTSPACDDEVPRLQILRDEYSGHGIQFVAVHVGGTEAQANTWLSGLGVTFPAIQDTYDEASGTYEIYNSYYEGGTYTFPHLYIIDRNGVIQYEHIGEQTEEEIEGHILDVVYMRDPIDVEMVMDVSDSMNSPPPTDPGGDSKLVLMQRAATMITDFLEDHGQSNDRMGMVWFTDDADEYEIPPDQKLFSVQSHATTLRTEINSHGTGVCTAMGAGLQKAFDTLSDSDQQRFAILCTDGMQNIEPKVTQVDGHFEIVDSGGWLCGGHSSVPAHPDEDIADYDTRVHTIGVGVTATYAPLLYDLANATHGFYRGTNDPDTDLDLIYFLDLCNCMAGASPAVAHHSVGKFYPEKCQTVEYFHLNRSVRKMTVALSWQRSLKGNLAFWLRSPDGTLLNLHQELKRSSDHLMATIHLPRHQDGAALEHVGRWQMIIRGETGGQPAAYHAIVIAEDRETHFHLDYPRRPYAVGDILPLQFKLVEAKDLLTRVHALELETARLSVPIPELMAELPISPYEIEKKLPGGEFCFKKAPVLAKLQALTADPRYAHRFKPERLKQTLDQGDLKYHIGGQELTLPIMLDRTGFYSFKLTLQCDTEKNGPICRTDMVTVNVRPGKPDAKTSRMRIQEIDTKKKKGVQIRYTPRNRLGNLLGPGYEQKFKLAMGKRTMDAAVDDLLNGTYLIDLTTGAEKKKKEPVQLLFQKTVIWKGEV
jgi:peroxiredoxin